MGERENERENLKSRRGSQCGTRSYNPEIKSQMLNRQRPLGAPTAGTSKWHISGKVDGHLVVQTVCAMLWKSLCAMAIPRDTRENGG